MIEIFGYEFMQRALIAGVIASVLCGVIGVYVILNRIVFIGGGIAHTAFGGMENLRQSHGQAAAPAVGATGSFGRCMLVEAARTWSACPCHPASLAEPSRAESWLAEPWPGEPSLAEPDG